MCPGALKIQECNMINLVAATIQHPLTVVGMELHDMMRTLLHISIFLSGLGKAGHGNVGPKVVIAIHCPIACPNQPTLLHTKNAAVKWIAGVLATEQLRLTAFIRLLLIRIYRKDSFLYASSNNLDRQF